MESRFDGYSERLEKTEIFDEITQKYGSNFLWVSPKYLPLHRNSEMNDSDCLVV